MTLLSQCRLDTLAHLASLTTFVLEILYPVLTVNHTKETLVWIQPNQFSFYYLESIKYHYY